MCADNWTLEVEITSASDVLLLELVAEVKVNDSAQLTELFELVAVVVISSGSRTCVVRYLVAVYIVMLLVGFQMLHSGSELLVSETDLA